jgi:hypothetical protein
MNNNTAVATRPQPAEQAIARVANGEMDGNRALVRGSAGNAPLTMNELKFFGQLVQQAGLVPKEQGMSDQQMQMRAMAKIVAGHAYGFDPILSLSCFDVINGKVGPTSACISLLIKRSGKYNYKVVTWTHTECDLLFVGKAADGTWKPLGHSTFTIDDAKKAGYVDGANKHNWTKIPRNMLLARAITNGKRLFCADVMDTGGYIGSGQNAIESELPPDDLEYAEPAQLEAGSPEIVDVNEAADYTAREVTADAPEDTDPVDANESRLLDLRTAVKEALVEKVGGLPSDQKRFLQGRVIDTESAEVLESMLADLAAM